MASNKRKRENGECNSGVQRVCGNQSCTKCFDKSFAKHSRASDWHPVKNGNAIPSNFAIASGHKAWFICRECSHELFMSLYAVSSGFWCKFCNNNVLCGNKNCKVCFEKSFAAHPKAKCWLQERNTLQSCQILASSKKEYWFACEYCKHAYKTQVFLVARAKTCKFCYNALCKDSNCQQCFVKSFASHYAAINWDDSLNGDLKPFHVRLHSDVKVWLSCGECNYKFQTAVKHISQGRWCPFCRMLKNKTKVLAKEFGAFTEHH